MKTPMETARYTFAKMHSQAAKACENEILYMIESAIESDRAQRAEISADWRDDQESVRYADHVSVKTPEEIAGEIFDAAFTLTESERFDDGRQDVEECSADYIREQIRLAILADRAQRDALKLRTVKSPGAVDRAVNRSNHAADRADEAERQAAVSRSAEQAALRVAATLKRKHAKIIEQARKWKHRALTAEADLRLAREQARHRESELVRAGRQQLLEAQALALDTIQRVAAQLPLDTAVISAEVIEPNIEVDTWFGEDDVPVVQIDTPELHGRLRINLNDGVVWDGDPETDERPGKNAELVEWEQRALAQAETISRQLDTIRDQAESERKLREVTQHCNEQLAALAAAAKLRDQQVETLARLWSAAFEHRGSPVGAVITRQLYRVMADHGVDVSNMPDPITFNIADCA